MTDTSQFPSDEELNHIANNPHADGGALVELTGDLLDALEATNPGPDEIPPEWVWLSGVFWDVRQNQHLPLNRPGYQYMVPLRHLGHCDIDWDEWDATYWAVTDEGEFVLPMGEIIARTLAEVFDAATLPGVFVLVVLGEQDLAGPRLEMNLVGLTDSFKVGREVALSVGADVLVDCSDGLWGHLGKIT